MSVVVTLCSVIGTVLSVLTAYKIVLVVIGVFKTKYYPQTENKHTYGICIAARNEEKVIQNLLDSIANQDYPLDKLRVFLVADNCTDNTAEIARKYAEKHSTLNLSVYQHNDPNERTKGYALRYLFDRIKEDFGIENFDGYFIFDADNVLNPDYVTRMNEAFDAGNKIITSFRHSKNMHQNWISFSYAIHWMRTCVFENRAKSILNMACRIQGTGFLFANEVVREGWNYVTLTEDRSFCSDAVVKNYRITYCDDAQFFDEQPYKFRVAFRQRVRWAKGHLQSTVVNSPKLLKNLFRKDRNFFTTYDCFWLNFPNNIESLFRQLLSFSMKLAMAIIACNALGFFKGVLITYVTNLLLTWVGGIIESTFVLIYYWKRAKVPDKKFKTVFNIFMFPLFDIIGKWCMYTAFVSKVEWKPIPHETVMDIDTLNCEHKKEEDKK